MSSGTESYLCPCGSARDLNDCCLKIIRGEQQAETAEALMRARYSAYTLAEDAYLRASWHASTRPGALNLSTSGLIWTGLKIVRCINGQPGDDRGMVEFIASYSLNGNNEQIHELSRFVFEQGQWFYLHGDLQQQKIARNSLCPCGSGKKYKHCCA